MSATTTFDKIRSIWSMIRSADHVDGEWSSDAFALDPINAMPGMNNYPMMVVNARRENVLATLDWISASDHAREGYVLSSRRIHN